MSFLKTQVSFHSNVAAIFIAIKQNSPILFLAQTLYTLFKRSPLMCKFFRFWRDRVKIRQIIHVNFELTSQFLFKFCIIFECLDTKLPCKFKSHKFSTLERRILSKSQFFRLSKMLWRKLAKFPMLFLKAQVNFPSNVASVFSAIKQNFSILFLTQTLYTLFKRSSLKCKFMRFPSARVKIRQIPHASFELTSQFLFKFGIICRCDDT